MAIQNPVINPTEGTYNNVKSSALAPFIARIWQTVVIVGGLILLLYLILGAVEWLTSGGEKEKLEGAKQKITNAVIGLAILVCSYAIVAVIEKVFGVSITNIVWPVAQ